MDDPQVRAETRRRRIALAGLGLMAIVFIILSAFSFVSSRDQITPDTVVYAGEHGAVDGKRVFQAYGCMGCHTIVGNGAYLGPDLTNTYEDAGPAYLAAFLPSAGQWPTEAALRVQVQQPQQVAETGIADLAAYYEAFPGAKERIERRGGLTSYMPNLGFRPDEVPALIAFLKYTSLMDTEGWPPVPKVDGLTFPQAAGAINTASDGTEDVASTGAAGAESAVDLVATGELLVTQLGCLACHATDSARKVGPGWGGRYGTVTDLADGGSALIDDGYLMTAITDPDAQVVAGYPAGTMPSYATVLAEDDVNAIVAFIRSLEHP